MAKKLPLAPNGTSDLNDDVAISTVPPASRDVSHHSRVRMKALSYDSHVDAITDEVREKIISALHNINQPLSVLFAGIDHMSDFAPDGTFDRCFEALNTMVQAQADRMSWVQSGLSDSSLDSIQEFSSIVYRQLIILPPLLHFAHEEMHIKNPEGAYDDIRVALDRLSLDVDRLSALCFDGRNETESQRFDVLAMVESLVRRSRLGDIIAYKPTAPVHIQADKRDIEQVIENLLSNAYKYGQEASIVITTMNNMVRIEVRDKGPGIAEEDESLFEMFNRGEVSPTIEGYGVGLAYCKRVVGEAGGMLSARNILDLQTGGVEGACFSVELPIVE